MAALASTEATAIGGKPVIVIAGPTAVGKSDVALELCKRVDGEIISADSVQVYRGCDIGSNKASMKEQAAVPHHLIDFLSPAERYTAGRFVRDCVSAIADIQRRGKVPIVVGGTMLYLQWLVHGVPDAPKSDPELACSIAEELKPHQDLGDWVAGIKVLEELDPKRAEELAKNDWYRLARAIEVARLDPSRDTRGERVISEVFDYRCYFLTPIDRRALFHRIDERCEQMLMRGLIDEVANLMKEGVLTADSMAARAIGYRQTIEYLSRPDFEPHQEDELKDFIFKFCAATRGYASRQIKWFRKDPRFMFVRLSVPDDTLSEEERVVQRREVKNDRETAVGTIVSTFSKSRDDFSSLLHDQAQEALRNDILNQGKLMRTFTFQLHHFQERTPRFQELLRNSDSHCQQLRDLQIHLVGKLPSSLERAASPVFQQSTQQVEGGESTTGS